MYQMSLRSFSIYGVKWLRSDCSLILAIRVRYLLYNTAASDGICTATNACTITTSHHGTVGMNHIILLQGRAGIKYVHVSMNT